MLAKVSTGRCHDIMQVTSIAVTNVTAGHRLGTWLDGMGLRDCLVFINDGVKLLSYRIFDGPHKPALLKTHAPAAVARS